MCQNRKSSIRKACYTSSDGTGKRTAKESKKGTGRRTESGKRKVKQLALEDKARRQGCRRREAGSTQSLGTKVVVSAPSTEKHERDDRKQVCRNFIEIYPKIQRRERMARNTKSDKRAKRYRRTVTICVRNLFPLERGSHRICWASKIFV